MVSFNLPKFAWEREKEVIFLTKFWIIFFKVADCQNSWTWLGQTPLAEFKKILSTFSTYTL